MQDRMLPDEVLQVIFTIAIEDKASLSILLPLVNKYFLELITKTTKNLLAKYLGPFHDVFRYSFIHPYPALFYKTIRNEHKRLNRVNELGGVSLASMRVEREEMHLPDDLDFFVISAVSARAYEELHVLVEQIKLKYAENISLRRVIDAVYLQAMLNYNDVEFLRLSSFIPVEIDSIVGYVCIENRQKKYRYLSLIEHAVGFGNKELVIGLIKLGAKVELSLLEGLKNRLAKFPDQCNWQKIQDYLLECASPHVAPLDCPGPL